MNRRNRSHSHVVHANIGLYHSNNHPSEDIAVAEVVRELLVDMFFVVVV